MNFEPGLACVTFTTSDLVASIEAKALGGMYAEAVLGTGTKPTQLCSPLGCPNFWIAQSVARERLVHLYSHFGLSDSPD